MGCRPLLLHETERHAEMVDAAGHRYLIDVPAGHYVYGVVEPEAGFDLAVTVFDARGRAVGGTVDFEGEASAERFHLATERDARFAVAVRGFLQSGERGRYTIRLDGPRPATEADRRRAEGHAAVLTARTYGSCRDKLPHLDRADRLYSDLPANPDDAFTHAMILLWRGRCLSRQVGDLPAAIEVLEHALERAGRSRDPDGIQPHVLSTLGYTERRAGFPERAADHLNLAIEGFRKVGEDRERLAAMLTLATAYTDVGAWEDNLRIQRQVLREARDLGLHEQAAFGIANQGWTLMRRGQSREAQALFDEAEALIPENGEFQSLRATLLINRGFVALDLREWERADGFFVDCMALTDDRRNYVLAQIGRVYVAIARGDVEQARRLGDEALASAEALGRPTFLARALDARARVRALDGSAEALRLALDDAEASLDVLESTRPDRRDVRAGYLDRNWNLVEMPIAFAVRLHELEPGLETFARAFDNAERVRFRTLVEQLGDAETAADRPSIETIRAELLDDETALLQFHLGERSSFLFRITTTSQEIFRLPPRDVLEARVAELRRMVTLRSRAVSRREILDAEQSYPSVAGELSDLLLADALADLDASRLLIAADGDLHALPFAALPEPGTPVGPDWRPLLVDREIAHVPSSSVVLQLRARPRGQPPTRRDLVVFADPVFGAPDPRLTGLAAPAGELPRLPHTAAEATAIAGWANPRSAIHTGFDASRDRILAGGLEGFRIAHFATHGRIGRGPTQTVLLLSQVDRQGSSIDGELTLADLSALDLDAELVVLSACETAFGHELRGEGLLGLARGFMNAGVPRVVASLWKVDDRATRDLMVELYQRLLKDGERPAAALRAAQQTLHARGEPVYHWAPFILQGEWL